MTKSGPAVSDTTAGSADVGDRYGRQLQTIAENATLALFIMDERQHCTFMNPAAERLTGYTLAEVQGRPLHDVIHHTRPDGRPYPLSECPIDRALPKNMREQGEEVFVHKNGSFYPVAFTASPIREADRSIGTIIEVRDLRSEKELGDTLQRIGASLASNLDLDALVQEVTDEATRLTGAQFGAFFYNKRDEQGEAYTLYTISGVPREAFSKFAMPRNTQVFDPTFRGVGVVRSDDIRADPRYGKNPPYNGMPKGHLPVVSYLAVPVVSRTGEVIGGLFFGHEQRGVFTKRHEQLVVGIAAWAAVAIDNARLYEAERHARMEAEQANRAKSDFLATMSHELRTPLNAIAGYADLLASEVRGPLLPLQKEDVQRIRRNQRHLLGIINDILNFAKLEAGRVEFRRERIALRPLMRELDDLVQPLVVARKLVYESCSTGEEVWVEADRDKVQQVLLNLLGNGAKFTAPGGTLRITCNVHKDTVDIAVADTGTGIPADKLAAIFDPFVQVNSSLARDTEGVGLGLAISRDLARGMGGDIRVESTPGQGSTFTLTLKRARA